MKQQAIDILDDEISKQQWESHKVVLRKAKKRIQALGDGWIPVTERLPEEGQEVNAFDGISVLQSEYLNGFFRASNQDSHRYFSITHWQPLPLPPKK